MTIPEEFQSDMDKYKEARDIVAKVAKFGIYSEQIALRGNTTDKIMDAVCTVLYYQLSGTGTKARAEGADDGE